MILESIQNRAKYSFPKLKNSRYRYFIPSSIELHIKYKYYLYLMRECYSSIVITLKNNLLFIE